MNKSNIKLWLTATLVGAIVVSCGVPKIANLAEKKAVPESFAQNKDTLNTSNIKWKDFFKDKNLSNLIEIALANNQELMITLQEVEIAKNDIRVKKGAILPSIGLRAGAGVEKVGRYTSQGAGDASAEILPGKEVPEDLQDFRVGAVANWEVDIWKKLRNSKKAAISRYLATVEGKNFVITNLIGEIASSYYELIALDNQLEIIKQNIDLQSSALEIVKLQKESSQATELGVQRFQAEVYDSKSKEFEILQSITETENKINFLLGRFPQVIIRNKSNFLDTVQNVISAGIPSQLLNNRPDIKQAESELVAAKLDIKVAKAEFYPSLGISAGVGLNAFKTQYLTTIPESLFYNLVGDVAGPLINRNAIKAEFLTANSRQIQSLFNYEKTVLNAFLEVSNQVSKISNLDKNYNLKTLRVDALNKSISASNDLFKSARIDYFEVLMTQRDVLEAKLELVETKKEQLTTMVAVYRSLGGGWR
jgi:NodT family efflux transporter outer membrane factor (OMF) lipoprotein